MLIGRNDMSFCRTKYKKMCQRIWILSFIRNFSNKYGKQLLDTAAKTGLVSLKSTSKKVFHKASEATGEFIWNKFADKIVNPKPVTDEKLRDVEELIVVPVKKRRNIE